MTSRLTQEEIDNYIRVAGILPGDYVELGTVDGEVIEGIYLSHEGDSDRIILILEEDEDNATIVTREHVIWSRKVDA